MAAKKTVPSKSSDQVININLETFIMPFAIVLSTIIFSTSFLISVNKLAKSISGEITVGSDRDTGTDTNDTVVPPAANPTGTANIDNDAVLGDIDNAKVAIIEFTDFECPFCQRHHQQTYPEIVKNYIETGKAIYVVRDYPLSFHEPAATKAAIAAECVKDLTGDSAYFKFIDLYFDKTATNGAGVGSDSVMADLAEEAGTDKGDFEDCLAEERFADEVESDTADGSAAGVTGTPGFIVGVFNKDDGSVTGVNISGAQPYATFQAEIEAQLEKAN